MKLKSVVLALLVTAGTAVANVYPRQVDFSGVIGTVDITLQAPPGGLTPNNLHLGGANGVTFQYDPQGSGTTASADSSGIFGSTGGALNLYFNNPAVGLRFNFSVLSVPVPTGCSGSCAVTDSLILFDNGYSATPGTWTAYSGSPSLGDITGDVNYTTTGTTLPPFTLVTLYPSTAGTTFSIGPIIQFDSTVPEPASFLLPMGMGMLGLGFAHRFSKRRS